MTPTIKPFKATYYNSSIIKDMSFVASPPYDVISKKQLAALKRKSPYNFCNILLADNGDYNKVGKKFNEWLKKKVLIDDGKSSLYLYEQKFRHQGRQLTRYGILSLLRMDKKNKVSPHEHTLKAPKKDRKKIIETVRANLSPIFVIAPTKLVMLASIYKRYRKRKPFMRFKDLDGNINHVWKIDRHQDINKVCGEINRHKLVIADGHHRFEVSYGYYQRNKDRFKDLNYILTYITDSQKGLLILPTHRIAALPTKKEKTINKLKDYFHIQKITEKRLEKKLRQDKSAFSFGMYLGNGFYFLKLKKPFLLDKIIDNPVYKKLDTYVLHNFVFSLLKIKGDFSYTHTVSEAKSMTHKGEGAFLLRGLPLKTLFEISSKGWRLPQKSTYFYPKAYSGIVVRRFVN